MNMAELALRDGHAHPSAQRNPRPRRRPAIDDALRAKPVRQSDEDGGLGADEVSEPLAVEVGDERPFAPEEKPEEPAASNHDESDQFADEVPEEPEAEVAVDGAAVDDRDLAHGPFDSGATKTSAPKNCFKYGDGEILSTDKGVYFVEGDDGRSKKLHVCSPLRVRAKTRDAKSGAWGRLLEWPDADGVEHRWAMPVELLEGDGIEMRKELARQGLSIGTSRKARELLSVYIKLFPVADRARSVDRLGWHGSVYCTPTETIGDSGELVLFQTAHETKPEMREAGTIADWRDSVAALAAGNSRFVFTISAAFAGPLMEIASAGSGGFHLRGRSSSGKSTALLAAASVFGPPRRYKRSWRSTINGLEGLAAIHNDGVLILDELSQCDPREAGESIYLLANEQGKARAARNGLPQAAQHWRLLFLSAGEESLAALMAKAGKKTTAGQEIRFADFDADAGAGMGVVESLHDCPHSAALVRAIDDAAERYHGAVGMAWLRRIVPDKPRLLEVVPERIDEFVAEVVPAGASGQVQRVARRFALVAVAGELATHYGLTGWVKGEAELASKACFAAWLHGFGGIGSREERAILEQVRAFFEAHGSSRFQNAEARDDDHLVDNRAGFYRAGPDGTCEYLVLPETFRNELCAGVDTKLAERVLTERGWIARGGDGRATKKPRLPILGSTTRVYVFTAKMWEDDQ